MPGETGRFTPEGAAGFGAPKPDVPSATMPDLRPPAGPPRGALPPSAEAAVPIEPQGALPRSADIVILQPPGRKIIELTPPAEQLPEAA